MCIFNRGRGILEENEIFLSTLTGTLSNVLTSVALQSSLLFSRMYVGVLVNGSNPILKHNKIFNGQSAGLEITNGGGGIYEENEVYDNKAGGICVATGCTPKMNSK